MWNHRHLALSVGHLPEQDMPASAVSLVKDADGDPPHGDYNYTSIISMMQYLQVHSWPEISYAVSQCARFMHCPRRSHEVTLEWIGLCLKGTAKEALILHPCKDTEL